MVISYSEGSRSPGEPSLFCPFPHIFLRFGGPSSLPFSQVDLKYSHGKATLASSALCLLRPPRPPLARRRRGAAACPPVPRRKASAHQPRSRGGPAAKNKTTAHGLRWSAGRENSIVPPLLPAGRRAGGDALGRRIFLCFGVLARATRAASPERAPAGAVPKFPVPLFWFQFLFEKR